MARLSEYAAGELPPSDAGRVSEHVERCSSCRQMVEALHLIGPALSAVTEGRPVEEVDHTFALARAGARASRDGLETGGPVGEDRHPKRAWLRMAAMAACLTLTAGLTHLLVRTDATVAPAPEPGQFVSKGGENQVLEDISLSFSVQSTGGTMSRGLNGGSYRGEDLLYFRVALPRDGYLLLVRVASDGIEPLTTPDQREHPVMVNRGDWDLSDGAHLLSFSLDKLKGTQRFVAIFSAKPFSLTPSIRAALQSGADASVLRRHQLVMDEVKVEVVPP